MPDILAQNFRTNPNCKEFHIVGDTKSQLLLPRRYMNEISEIYASPPLFSPVSFTHNKAFGIRDHVSIPAEVWPHLPGQGYAALRAI